MVTARDLPTAVRDSLARLAKSSDRASPTVFVGREEEFALLDDAVRGVLSCEGQAPRAPPLRAQHDESGHTVLIQGVPGAGKTALLNEYATRLLMLPANVDAERPVTPVPLQLGTIDRTPAAIVQEIDRQFREFEASNEWRGRVNRAVSGASLLGNALFAAFTKRDINDFRPSAKSPDSLPIALEDYVAFRFDRSESTIVLLVDEAQNLPDTARVRDHLGVLHSGITGRTQVLLACFGLEDTTDRLRELGLSRLATGHTRSVGVLSDEEAKQTVTGTLEAALAELSFADDSPGKARRSRWIDAAAATILAESANFPHHLVNGCRALAHLVLDEGIGDVPAEKLRDQCRAHRREYYDARLRPWANHMTALAHAFGSGNNGWTTIGDVKRVLMAADDFGDPVDAATATGTIKELCAQGYVEARQGVCRPVLPSLSSYFDEMRQVSVPDNEVVRAVRRALEK